MSEESMVKRVTKEILHVCADDVVAEEVARDAIEAMRFPPKNILTAFVDAGVSLDDAATRWDAAITAALKEPA